jgi:hypothetical protein
MNFSEQQVNGTRQNLVGAVRPDDLERQIFGHRRFSRSAADRALLAETAA